jgi:hypothetical protein
VKAVTPRIDVSREELEALLEGVRPALGEAGYQKLQAAIRTLNYVCRGQAKSSGLSQVESSS